MLLQQLSCLSALFIISRVLDRAADRQKKSFCQLDVNSTLICREGDAGIYRGTHLSHLIKRVPCSGDLLKCVYKLHLMPSYGYQRPYRADIRASYSAAVANRDVSERAMRGAVRGHVLTQSTFHWSRCRDPTLVSPV